MNAVSNSEGTLLIGHGIVKGNSENFALHFTYQICDLLCRCKISYRDSGLVLVI